MAARQPVVFPILILAKEKGESTNEKNIEKIIGSVPDDDAGTEHVRIHLSGD